MTNQERDRAVRKAVEDIAFVVAGNNKLDIDTLVDYFYNNVTIKYGQRNDNPNHAAATSGAVSKINSKYVNTNLGVNLPLPPDSINSPDYYWWVVDIHHELFHIFTKIINSNSNNERINDNLTLVSTGGVITKLVKKNGVFQNGGQMYCSKMMNELTTDLMAYILTYTRFYPETNYTIEDIIDNNGLEEIEAIYKHKNGYYELLQLELLMVKAFNNYSVSYDSILRTKTHGIFDLKYPSTDNQTVYYNDLFYGVMCDPISLKNQIKNTLGVEDYNRLEDYSYKIINNFENNGRTIDKQAIINVMNLLKTYFDKRIQYLKASGVDDDTIIILQRDFYKRFQKAASYYEIPLVSTNVAVR